MTFSATPPRDSLASPFCSWLPTTTGAGTGAASAARRSTRRCWLLPALAMWVAALLAVALLLL